MRRADHARFRVDEKRHAAIGAGDGEREPRVPVTIPSQRGRSAGAQGSLIVVTSAECTWKGTIRRLGANAECARHARPVLGDRLGRVARADAAVERIIDALRETPPQRVKKAWRTP